MIAPSSVQQPRRILSVASIRFDEARQELTVDGQRRAIEAKPLALLHALLTRAGSVVSKRTLIEAVWGNADVISEASLTTAMSKLRAALGDPARDVIEAVHGSGYRIAHPVEVTVARETPRLAFTFRAGEPVPGRPQWHLQRPLGASPLNDVWLARHVKTAEARVFKFADSTDRLDTLQREATLARILHTTLGPRDDLVRILEWNFDTRPWFIESAYGGIDLPAWVEARGGLAAIPLASRLALIAAIARTTAAAHAAGVLHGDLKPANILLEEGGKDAVPRVRLVDFGAGGLSDAVRLEALGITLRGLDQGGERGTGTLRYLAPELLAGGQPTTAADIYAIGVLLYQFAAADLTRPLTLGWEADIADPLLRQDIMDAAAGDPARRLASAAMLAERLETLPARRDAQAQQARQDRQAALLARELDRARLRRPWVIAAAVSLVLGTTVATWFAIEASRQRDEASRRAAIAQSVNLFLTEDLLGRGNPARSGKADETLMEAAQAAEAGIDRRLAHEPLVAGAIYLSLARAFDSRSAWDAARIAYDRAIARFTAAGEPGRADATIARLHEAEMEVVSGQPGSLPRARALIATAGPMIDGLGKRSAEAEVWRDAGTADLQMLGGDVQAAQAGFARAADRADAMPEIFDEGSRLALRQQLAFTYLRLGAWSTAETMFNALLQRRLALNGPRHPATLRLQLNLAECLGAQGKAAASLALLDQIAPDFMAVFGPDHLRTLELLNTRGQMLSQLGRYDEAVADQMTLHRRAVARDGARSFVALTTLADAATSECRAGRTEAGLAAAREAHDGAAAAFGAGSALAQALGADLAFCDIAARRFQEASPLLSGIDRRAVSELTMDPYYGAEIDVMRAAVARADGDGGTASALLAASAPALDHADADPFMRRWARELSGLK
jgi:DNA-binding winged helix-turn-helix (wHTH) protein/tetratricopeptide (TPR) repeat protein